MKDLQMKKALRSVLIVLLLCVAGMTKAYAVTIGDLNYTLHSTTLTATVIGHKDGTSATGELIIPETVTYNGNTYTVTSIYNNAFSNCRGLTGNLVFPNSITIIGCGAFLGCSGFTGSLTIPNSVIQIVSNAFFCCSGFNSLTIGSSVTNIGDDAFDGCTGFVGSLTIPNSVITIGDAAFYNCSGFTDSLTIGNSVTTIGNSAFGWCSGFTGSLTIGNSVTTIGGETFRNCSGFTGDLTIPNSVTTIGERAFWNCTGFTGSLTIGNSVTSIGNSAFYGCRGFTEVRYLGDVVEWCNISFSDFASNPLYYAHNLYINNNLVTNLIIPETVTEIKNYTFRGCSCFTGNLTIPNSVTSIGNSAFSGCSGLTSITLPNSLTTIGDYAFYNCSGFTGDLTIGNSVTAIGNYAFMDCNGFTSMNVLSEIPPTLGEYVFYGVNKSIPVYVPCGSLSAYQNATGWSEFTNIQEVCSQNQTVQLAEGTNWFSTNLDISLDDLKAALVATAPANTTITIKNATQSVVYSRGHWNGTLDWDVAKRYNIKVASACELTLEGMPIDPSEHPVTVVGGGMATWIGFPLGESMTLTNAFAGFAQNGDVVKSQYGNATYTRGHWNGEFSLEPGMGYLYISAPTAADRTLTFPAGAK